MSVFNVNLPTNMNNQADLKMITSYIYKLNEQLRYMFGNLTPEDNYSSDALIKYISDGEKIATMEFTVDGMKLEMVRKGEVVSAINMSEEEIKIMASKIKLEGIVTANGKFKILEDGSMESVNGKFSGNITGSEISGSQMTSVHITGGSMNVGSIVADDSGAEIGGWVVTVGERDTFQSFDESVGLSSNGGRDTLWAWFGWRGTNDYAMVVNTNDDVYIGRDLHTGGDIECDSIFSNSAGESWSDARRKENIESIDSDLAKQIVLNLKPVSFNMIHSGKAGIGFLAQDVYLLCEQIKCTLPLYGFTKDRKYFTIPYQNYIPLLVSTIQTQQQEIERIDNRLKAIERMVQNWH